MRYLFAILLLSACGSVFGQVHLNLEKCREMALESSKKMAIAEKQDICRHTYLNWTGH